MFLPSNITLSPGDSGEFVAELQRRLSTLNLFPAESASGFYDGMTTSAVTSFQFQQGLRSDGIAGPETLRRLNGVLSGTADSTPAATQTEEAKQAEAVQRNFHMIDTDAQAQQPDAFTFQAAEPTDIQPQVAAPIQPLQQPAPIQQPVQQPVQAQPAMPDISLLAQTQQPVPVAAPIEPRIAPPPLHPQTEPIAVKPDLGAQTPPPVQQQPVIAQPVMQQPQPTAQDVPAKPVVATPPAPEPLKPVEPALQPIQQQPVAQPVFQQPPQQQTPPVVAAPPPELKPLAEPVAKPVIPPVAQPQTLEAKPAAPAEFKPAAPAQQTTQETSEAAPERQSLRQRFSGMMQRIADYMESKLSPSVMAEVQKIGMQLNERGIRELPLPQNETALPSPSATPGRGQGQAEQR